MKIKPLTTIDYLKALELGLPTALATDLTLRYNKSDSDSRDRLWLAQRTLSALTSKTDLPTVAEINCWRNQTAKEPDSFAFYISASRNSFLDTSEGICLVYDYFLALPVEMSNTSGLVHAAYLLCLIQRKELASAVIIAKKWMQLLASDTETDCIGLGVAYRLIDIGLRCGARKATEATIKHSKRTIGLRSAVVQYQTGELMALCGAQDQALLHFRNALEAEDSPPIKKKIQFAVAMSDLLRGRVSIEALRGYEQRFSLVGRPYVNYGLWNGEENSTVVVFREQGLGDEIFFMRFALPLTRLYPSVRFLFEVDHRIKGIASQLFRNLSVFSRGDRVPGISVDFVMGMGSMPYWIASKGHLTLPPPRRLNIIRCSSRDSTAYKKRIGILWRSTSPKEGIIKSVSLMELISTIRDEFVDWELVSFQHDLTEEEKAACNTNNIETAYEKSWPLKRTYEKISACDLFIGICGSLTHLSATAGIPTIVLKSRSHVSSYSWSIGEQQLEPIWYGENVHIITQQHNGSWKQVLRDMTMKAKEVLSSLDELNE